MNKINHLVFVIFVLIVLGGGIFLVTNKSQPGSPQQSSVTLQNVLEPDDEARIATKLAHTPSAAEIAALATETYEKSQPYSLPAQKVSSSAVVNSVSDLPQVVYQDPFYSQSGQDFTACIQASQPGPPQFVESLGTQPGYYLLPFYQHDSLCGIALIDVDCGQGTMGGWSEARGGKFPAVNSEEAIRAVELETGQTTTGQPGLVFGSFFETPDPFSPFWKVAAADGQVFYVIGQVGIAEDGNSTLDVSVLNSMDMHPKN